MSAAVALARSATAVRARVMMAAVDAAAASSRACLSTAASGSATAATAAAAGASAASKRAAAEAALRGAHAVCFDVDSTVITVEAIDEFAAFCGKKEEVAALTARAMGGSVPFQDALAARLEIIAPTREGLAAFLRGHPFTLTPHVADVMARLRARGAAVYLVSGGFTQMIHPLADALGLPRSHVFANTILFADDDSGEGGSGRGRGGAYAGFDASAPTSRDGGKAEVVRRLMADKGYGTVVMVGDGATDMQARPPAAAFIGYGGVVKRAPVEAGADWFVTCFSDVLKVLA